jgi:hypothetical protein
MPSLKVCVQRPVGPMKSGGKWKRFMRKYLDKVENVSQGPIYTIDLNCHQIPRGPLQS